MVNDNMKIVIIIPAFNEESTIAGTILSFHQNLPEAEIWVVNNRSKDDTEKIAFEIQKELGYKGGILNEPRAGKSNAIRRAFFEIKSDIYILTDADMTYPAERVRDLIKPVLAGDADMVVGDRHSAGYYAAENRRIFHGFGNRLVRDLVNFLFRTVLMDIMSGYRALNSRFVRNYPILVEGFELETDMTLFALDKRFRIVEIPIEYRDRPSGSRSKLNTFRDGAKVIFTILNIFRHYRPLLFFGSLAIILGLTGFLAAIPVFMDWMTKHFIYHIPLAILATGLEIAAMLTVSIGLILDSINHQEKCQFERELLK